MSLLTYTMKFSAVAIAVVASPLALCLPVSNQKSFESLFQAIKSGNKTYAESLMSRDYMIVRGRSVSIAEMTEDMKSCDLENPPQKTFDPISKRTLYGSKIKCGFMPGFIEVKYRNGKAVLLSYYFSVISLG